MQIHKRSFLLLTISISLYLAVHYPLKAQLQRFKDNKSCLYGYTDKTGKRIIPAQYVYAQEYYHNYAIVGNGVYNGLLDTTGAFVLPLIYTQISDYDNCFLLKKDSIYSIFDTKDKKIHCKNFPYPITRYQTSHIVFQNGEYCGFACNEKIVVDNAYSIHEDPSTSIIIIHYRPYDNDSIRLYDLEKNAFVNQESYQQIYEQSHNYYSVKKGDLNGMIDKNGKTIIPFLYTQLYYPPYNYGPLVLRRKDNKGYDVYSRTGEKKNRKPYPFIDAQLLEINLYLITQKNKMGMLGPDGAVAIPCIYDSIIPLSLETSSPYVLLYQRKGIQIASYAGKILNATYYNNICFPKHISKRYEESEYYPEDGLLPLLVNIWPDSSVSIITADDLTEHKTGSDYQMSADVRLYANGKYGYLSADLEHVVPPAYDMIFPFEPEQYYTSILNEERFGIMTRNGDVIIEPEYLFIEQDPSSSAESFIFMSADNLFGIKSSEGEIIIQPAFSTLSEYDFENDYCWAQHADSTELRLMDRTGALKSLYDFEYPVSLSMQENVIVRVRTSDTDEQIYKTGVLDCSTLQPVVPFIYEKIVAITDSMYLCMPQEDYTDSTYSDLYINDVRIDSVTGISLLPNNVVAIERCYKWGYFKNGIWLIRPEKKTFGLSSEERALLQLNSQTINDLFNLYEEEYEVTLQFDSSNISAPLSSLLNNEILLWYCNNQKRSFSIMDNYYESYNFEHDDTPLLYTVDYVSNRIDTKDEEPEEYYYRGSSYFSSTFREMSAIVLTSSFAELRYKSEHWNRASCEITRDNKQYTITSANQFKQLSLADITNHPHYKALLSTLINIHLDSLEDIELPCTERDNIIELTTGYQFEKEGMRFYFQDERYSDIYDNGEINILIPYNELAISFKKSIYISDLYRNSLKQ